MVCCFRPVDCLLPTSLPLPRLLFHINRGSLFSGEFPVNTKRSQLFNRALSADGYAPRLLEIRKCPARVRIPVSLWFEFERGSGGTLRRKWTCSHQVVDGLDFEISSASITHFRNGTHSRWGVSITSVLQVGTGVHVMTIPLQLKEINDLWNNYRYCFYASSRNSAHYSNSSYFNMVSSSLFFFQQWVTCFNIKAGAIIVFQYFLLSLLHHYLQNHFFMIQVEAIWYYSPYCYSICCIVSFFF